MSGLWLPLLLYVFVAPVVSCCSGFGLRGALNINTSRVISGRNFGNWGLTWIPMMPLTTHCRKTENIEIATFGMDNKNNYKPHPYFTINEWI